MKKKMVALICASMMMLLAVAPASAHEYDRNDSDYFLRYISYAVYPVGMVLETCITRPIHRFVSHPKWSWWFGHEPTEQGIDRRVPMGRNNYGDHPLLSAEEANE